jgi:hypothetical protein
MATAKQSQLLVRANTAPGHRASEPRRTAAFVSGGVVAALGAAALTLTGPGAAVASRVFHFLEFYCGVFSLVALSITVMVGLAATDRVVLMVRHRVLMQGIHRALAIAAMVFLGIHVATKIVEGHASFVDVVVPFLASHRPLYVGLGTLASYLMIGVTITGVVRGRFAGSKRVWLWRALHAAAYLAWPVALLHGLNAGRPAKTWVTVSYLLCLILVGLAALVRVCVLAGNRLRAPRTHTTATLRPVGKVSNAPLATASVGVPGRPDRLRDTGSLPPVRDPFTDTGSTPRVRDGLRDTGSMPPVRDRVRDTGSMPPVRDRVRDTGSMPPVRDRMRDTGSMPPVRDRVRDTGSMPPVRDRVRDTGSMPPLRDSDIPTSPAVPSPAPAGARGGAAGGRPQRPGKVPIVNDEDFWAFMRGEGEQ